MSIDQGVGIRFKVAHGEASISLASAKQQATKDHDEGWLEPTWDDASSSELVSNMHLPQSTSPASGCGVLSCPPNDVDHPGKAASLCQTQAASSLLLHDSDLGDARMRPHNHFEWPETFTASQSACLMHLYTEVLAPQVRLL